MGPFETAHVAEHNAASASGASQSGLGTKCERPARRRHKTATAGGYSASEGACYGIQQARIKRPIGLAQQANEMGLMRDFKETIVERVGRDPDFAMALLDDAKTLFLNGEPQLPG